jgi:hypothetical protein
MLNSQSAILIRGNQPQGTRVVRIGIENWELSIGQIFPVMQASGKMLAAAETPAPKPPDVIVRVSLRLEHRTGRLLFRNFLRDRRTRKGVP